MTTSATSSDSSGPCELPLLGETIGATGRLRRASVLPHEPEPGNGEERA